MALLRFRHRRATLAVIAAIVGILFLVLALGLWACWYMWGPAVEVVNDSNVELEEVIITYRGGGRIVGALYPGATWRGRVRVSGDTSVTVSYRLPSGEEVARTGGYLTTAMPRTSVLRVTVGAPRDVEFW
ncbi:MAG: hypothetical protein AMJ81_12320 [Phycisphaerae bacterium SM23_33]|nr:MAG: hypothetical protein AMJ81_12320 [Phycisphaerae bacterium SM23_33]